MRNTLAKVRDLRRDHSDTSEVNRDRHVLKIGLKQSKTAQVLARNDRTVQNWSKLSKKRSNCSNLGRFFENLSRSGLFVAGHKQPALEKSEFYNNHNTETYAKN